MAGKKKTILILTGDAGLGHRIAAEAIQKVLQQDYADQCKAVLRNPLNHPDVPEFVRETQTDYDEIVKKFPDLYLLGYKISNAQLPVSLIEGGFTLLLLSVLREMISELKPDLVITTYPIYMAPLNTALEMENLSIPVMAVVTDYVTVHQVWFHDSVTRLAVPTETVREKALEAGLKDAQIVITGIPVDPQILVLKERSKNDVREELGWLPHKTSLLVVGSPRVHDLMAIIKRLDHSSLDFQFALVAGGNDDLFNSFRETNWLHPTKVYNFVERIPAMMRAADLILSKPGGLIVTESIASGLPMMLVHKLPGQERGNVGYIEEHHAGKYCETPEDALETLTLWLEGEGEELVKIAENSSKLGRPEAVINIVDEAWRLIDENF